MHTFVAANLLIEHFEMSVYYCYLKHQQQVDF